MIFSRILFICSCIVLLFQATLSSGQVTGIAIENVDFIVSGNDVVITYDIKNSNPDERFKIAVQFITGTDETINPVSVTGDIGYNVSSGKGKKITWTVLDDRSELQGSMKAVVSIESVTNVKYTNLGGGPSNAFLSILIPGFGDFFVRKNTEKKAPFVLYPLVTYGIFTYGFAAKMLSNVNYNRYHKSIGPQSSIDSTYDVANKYYRQSQIAYKTAFAIWGFDVVTVVIKGIRNNVIRKRYNIVSNSSVSHDYYIGYDPRLEGPRITYVIKF